MAAYCMEQYLCKERLGIEKTNGRAQTTQNRTDKRQGKSQDRGLPWYLRVVQSMQWVASIPQRYEAVAGFLPSWWPKTQKP